MSKEKKEWFIGSMKLCGRAVGSLRDIFYFTFPFMSPEEVEDKEIYNKQSPFTEKEEEVSEEEPVEEELKEEKESEEAKGWKIETETEEPVEKEASPGRKEEILETPLKPEEPKIFSDEKVKPSTTVLEEVAFDSERDRKKSENLLKNFRTVSIAERRQRIESFKEIIKPWSVLILQSLLKKEKEQSLKVEIIKALSFLASKKMRVSAEVLKPYLKEDDFHVRLSALRALYMLKVENLGELLIDKLNDPSPEVRLSAMNCLSWEYGLKAAPKIALLLYDPAAKVRKITAQNIGVLHFKEAVSALINLLSDEENEVKIAANDALKKITKKDFGFKVNTSHKEQQRIIEEWRKFWQENHSKI